MMTKIKSLFGVQAMTEGRPMTCLLKFSIPLIIGNIAQMMYTSVDAVIVHLYMGNLGDKAIAALTASIPIYNLFLVLFMALGSGVTIMVSQYFGAKDYENLGLAVGNAITLIAAVSVFITAVASPLTAVFLRIVQTPDDIFAMARTYLMILFLGSIGNGFYNILSSILRGMGEAVFPLLVLLGTVILNAILAIWFVKVLHMGVGGSALATTLAQLVSSVVCVIKILSMKDVINLKRRMLKLRGRTVRQLVRLGVPTGVSMGIQFGATIFIQSIANSMGSFVNTAIGGTLRIDGFAVLPSQTFAMAASTFTGQNIGAGKMDRVKKGSWTVFYMCLIFTGVMISCMLLFGRDLLTLFINDSSLMDLGMGFIHIMIPAYFAMAVNQTFSGVMRGAGDAMGPMWIALSSNVLLRVPLAYLFRSMTRSDMYPKGNPNALFSSLLVCMIFAAVVTVVYYRIGKWKNKAIVGNLKTSDGT